MERTRSTHEQNITQHLCWHKWKECCCSNIRYHLSDTCHRTMMTKRNRERREGKGKGRGEMGRGEKAHSHWHQKCPPSLGYKMASAVWRRSPRPTPLQSWNKAKKTQHSFTPSNQLQNSTNWMPQAYSVYTYKAKLVILITGKSHVFLELLKRTSQMNSFQWSYIYIPAILKDAWRSVSIYDA